MSTLSDSARPQVAWFCVRSQPKHEHIAAAHLRRMDGVEVFLPRLRFQRPARHRAVWVTEPLFPNYLFARFDWSGALRKVHHAPGVSTVVHFGNEWPTVPAEVIDELRSTFGREEVHTITSSPAVGEEVQISGGLFHGLRAVVTQLMPGRERVRVLLEFLGRQTTVEIAWANVVRPSNPRKLFPARF